MSSPAVLKHRYGEPRLPGSAWLIMWLLTAVILWAHGAEIERIVVAQGRVAPHGEVKVIQHLEGGIIEAFHVSEGDRVRPGDRLLTLNLGGRGINQAELQVRLDRRRLTRARLEAEASGQPVAFPAEIAERQPVLLASEQAAFAARQLELESALKVLEQQKTQRHHRIAELATSRDTLEDSLDRRRLTQARLEAEASGQPIAFPAEIAERQPVLLASEQAAFAARQLELESALKVLEQQKTQRQRRIAELRAEYQAVQRSLSLDRQELAVQKELHRQKLASELTLIAARRRVEDKLGKVEILASTIATREAEVAEFSARVDETTARFRRQAQDTVGTETEALAEELGQFALISESIQTLHSELAEFSARVDETTARFRRQAREEASLNEGEITALEEQLRVADEQRGRSVIRSPIEGEVKNFRYHTVGGVIRSGEAVLEIVPLLERLVIDARLQPADRGFINLGMDADIKVTAYDFVRHGSLPGRVSHIAPDTSFDENTGPYYRVVLTTQRSYLGDDPAVMQITPGMTALAEVKVGTQSVLNALIRPVLKTGAEAFREP
ncbi:MAG: HlyD family efflux transporter periplasmic adaptor subunit [Arenicellales bacterium]|jgi:adhesin transport system membrane fusion protein|nr:HlyD family efflux transporter periplasmic adaptor subunit [Arenicellales bacterium]MDP6855575.1 HlyD family efflux transporter periplasmic adaptor subunit [Arenicellales bacterium]